jgi:DNA (cytosine-5)-methyltransferase 1
MNLRIGSLFAGYGGLELGVSSVLGGRPAWFSEIEPAPTRVLAHHWPDVPNLGDITTIDWDTVEPIDVLTGGFPCQDVSHAGKRLGLKPGTRSGLWSHMAYAIDKLRPRLVVAENVRGLLSAEAGGDLEPCPWCVGDGERGALRALGAVLGDLADLGYDAQWVGVRASDAGAPHGRFRVFVFAWPADTTSRRWPDQPGEHGVNGASVRWEPRAGDRGDAGHLAAGVPQLGRGTAFAPADTDRVGHQRPRDTRGRRPRPADSGEPPADTDVTGREGPREPGRADTGRAGTYDGRRHAPGRGSQTPADADSDGREGVGRDAHGRGGADTAWGDYEPTTRGTEAPPDTWRGRRGDGADAQAGEPDTQGSGGGPTPERPATAWGEYEPAIRLWERLTRPAPPPTEPSRNGAARLSPAFVEWMQGLPAGHVTAVPGLTRNDQLKALGNGCVPQQVALAVRLVLGVNSEVMPTVRPDLCEAI